MQNKSNYELLETLDCLCRLSNLLHDYRHVIEEEYKICKSVRKEIDAINKELERREEEDAIQIANETFKK